MNDQTLPSADELHFAYLREKSARKQSELLLQTKTRQLYLKNEELKRKNNELQAHQRATIQHQKLAGLGTLIAGMAHEINNPLAYVIGNVQNLRDYVTILVNVIKAIDANPGIDRALLQTVYEEETRAFPRLTLDDIVKDSLDMIDDSEDGLKRVKSIVLNLKNFSRNDENSRSKYNVQLCVQSALNILSGEIKGKCDVVCDLQPVPLIFCSPNSLTQVIINLIMNAMQAFQDGVRGAIHIECYTETTDIIIRIADNGCGMSNETLKKIFVPFFTTKPYGVGTGLGLAICYEKIKDLGGAIDLVSEINEGTTVTIILPLEQRSVDRSTSGREII